ncbi:D-aminoacyl-tRNA deacylase [Akkermansiaceae bacterium]|nr:D-aminoacyl-tRNA deacylase [Akkermansiaceae bacterium]MDA7933627.1 D-aminoacyl-tRNA deacylase [Akkermansiaceae bacterium]MDB4484562.1 D-aminoacyl-tRNA deacylase [bacterium]
MRVVLQRVSEASVTVEGEKISEIGNGFLILLGIESADDQSDIDWLIRKIINMRIFDDKDGKMNLSLQDKNGEALVVSQFTLHASTKKGNRPSFIKAARPELSEPLYESFCESFSRELGRQVGRGSFGAMMEVALINDGPVTIKMDSRDRE